ncbi:hypothetical protein PG994_014448 [Apiospora phragmitis]|uniref:Uncharacterized protein n=1 Tax=Apiospora phragmitis TaxID=2905665 RepID=A0ABR1T4C0_9PEZI
MLCHVVLGLDFGGIALFKPLGSIQNIGPSLNIALDFLRSLRRDAQITLLLPETASSAHASKIIIDGLKLRLPSPPFWPISNTCLSTRSPSSTSRSLKSPSTWARGTFLSSASTLSTPPVNYSSSQRAWRFPSLTYSRGETRRPPKEAELNDIPDSAEGYDGIYSEVGQG